MMPDREKTVKELDRITSVLFDALTLLKEQQPKKSRWMSIPHKKDRICERCGHDEPYKFAEKEAEVYQYCPHCGAKMENGTD